MQGSDGKVRVSTSLQETRPKKRAVRTDRELALVAGLLYLVGMAGSRTRVKLAAWSQFIMGGEYVAAATC